jgi:tetratricopeptide (TPR) repeat protein
MDTSDTSKSTGGTSKRTLAAVAVAALACLGLLAGGGLWLIFQALRDSGASQTAQAFLREHPIVQEDLGRPIELDGFVLGKLSEGAETGSAELTIPLRGSRGSGLASVTLEKSEGQWHVTAALYEGRGGVTRRLAATEEGSAAAAGEAAPPEQDASQRKLAEAYALYQAGKSQEALQALDELLEQSPDDAEALYWRAQLRAKLGEEEAAREDILRAVALDVDLREAYQLHDYLLTKQRRWEEIIHAWTQHLERHPDDDVALLERAGARKHSGDRERALEDLERSCELGNAQACAILRRETGR